MSNNYKMGLEDSATFGPLENQQGLEESLLLKHEHNWSHTVPWLGYVTKLTNTH